MTDEKTVIEVDQKLFQDVVAANARVSEYRADYESAKSTAASAKKRLDGACETLESLVRRLGAGGRDDLPLFDSQTDAIDKATNDPVVSALLERLLEAGHELNVLIVAGYTPDERQAATAYLDARDLRLKLEAAGETDLPDVEVPAFLVPQPLTAIEVADLIRRIEAASVLVEPDEIHAWTPAQLADVRDWLSKCEAVQAEKGEAVTFDDLPRPPAVLDTEATDDAPATAVEEAHI